ncbi:MAG: TetR family transcriptional regulator [unclassified Hahellaceae]|nr:TetR family transcriptional regulator [Hahellaceae bacterium]|tara:strand:+ start:22385 stop:23017 length:633 start_codon:yes stop_codon:yes gene_type:complete
MPSSPSNQSYHHGSLRAALLSHAMELLDTKGIEGVSIRAVARLAGVAHSAPANHFPNKRSLMSALAARIFNQLENEVLAQMETTSGQRAERVMAFAEAVVAFALTYPHRYRLLWRRESLIDHDAELHSAMEAVYALLIGTIEGEDDEFTTSLETRAIAIWSMVHGYLIMRLDGNLMEKTDELTQAPRHRAIITALLEGIGGGPSGARRDC